MLRTDARDSLRAPTYVRITRVGLEFEGPCVFTARRLAMARKTWTVLLVVALSTGLAGCSIWPMLHGDALRSGVANDGALGASHAPNLSLRWKTLIRESVESSPAIVYNSNLRKMLVYTS